MSNFLKSNQYTLDARTQITQIKRMLKEVACKDVIALVRGHERTVEVFNLNLIEYLISEYNQKAKFTEKRSIKREILPMLNS